MPTLCITIDMLSLYDYAQRRGIALTTDDPMQIYREPLGHFADLCAYAGGKGTIFSVTRDVLGIASQRLAQLNEQGFEIASYSHEGDPNFAWQNTEMIIDELERSRSVIQRELNTNVLGFRTPGYRPSRVLISALIKTGYIYDSSVIPSPWPSLGRIFSKRATSAPTLTIRQEALAPKSPYEVNTNPYRQGSNHLIELPLSVTKFLRIPLTSAIVIKNPRWFKERALPSFQQQKHIVFSVDAVDLLETGTTGIPSELTLNDATLAIPLKQRLKNLGECLHKLGKNRSIITCRELAQLTANEK